MSAFPHCAALLRNGQPCGRTVGAGREFCVHHAKLLETIDAESLRQGRIPKKRALKDPPLRFIMEPPEPPIAEAEAEASVTSADPATVRPSLALAAAENVEALKESLLQAAAAATKPTWITVECSGCGERSRIEAPVPDVRARVAAIELLLREGLGRPATAEEVTSPQLPTNVAAVGEMTWEEMQALFAAIYVDEIAAAQRDGSEALVEAKVAALSEGERRVLREALDAHAASPRAAASGMANVLAVFAQFERRLIAERTKAALAIKRAQGVRLGRPASIPDELAKRIVRMRERGLTLQAICDRLNAERVPTPRGGAFWRPTSLRAVLAT